ncbi:MAG TPA: metallophosphoesterase [Polyangia bacterium]|nr:metallophosphoesterase [Polyangia bacterium]
MRGRAPFAPVIALAFSACSGRAETADACGSPIQTPRDAGDDADDGGEFPSDAPAIDGWHAPAPAAPDARCAFTPAPIADPPGDAGAPTRFVVLGDYGSAGPDEEAVADLVHRLGPELIITTGDNNYPLGEEATIDLNVGAFYHDFIAPYVGRYGCGAARNRFFPALGNHDWYTSNAAAYLAYFTLPGNERYYDFAWGDVHFFAIDSDPADPDGLSPDGVQGRWLRAALAAATERWRVVYMHRPPYSSGPHGSSPDVQWPFKDWGADLVLSGHEHDYERLVEDGLTYVVNGLGGAELYFLGPPVQGSVTGFEGAFGAMVVEADASTLEARFMTVDGRTPDEFTLP